MQGWLWSVHLAGILWYAGWNWMIPIGGIIYGWLLFKAFVIDAFIFYGNYLLGNLDKYEAWILYKYWLMGPMRRAVMGSFIFFWNLILMQYPFLNIFTSIVFAYWAVADYYDYDFDFDTFTPTNLPWFYKGNDGLVSLMDMYP